MSIQASIEGANGIGFELDRMDARSQSQYGLSAEEGGGVSIYNTLGASLHGVQEAFYSSFFMIIANEIGDETFFIAALMAMRHARLTVFSGAFSALILMTILSTALGMVIPNLISKEAIRGVACLLYTIFGLRLLYIALTSTNTVSASKAQEELEEAQDKIDDLALQNKDELGGGSIRRHTIMSMMTLVCSRVYIESFVLTFLAEWGDRSQIATITLASHAAAAGVAAGAIIGHAICTGFAVVGGRYLAMKISQRTVALVGAMTFFGFAIFSYFSVAY